MTEYLDLEDVLDAAEIAIAPAELKVRDIGLLESAVARPQASAFGEDAYPDLFLKAAALMESLARNHALIDGNKRLAWVATRYFLIRNGTDVRASSAVEGDRFVREVAQGMVELADIARRLRDWQRF
ncbi:MAG: death on curing protein [Pseudonocardiales bacterium]|nr:death on curing protein [Pseudonocardiales bacterium]MDT4920512.1 death on curing protein [Pseudonocardiales bacterium]